MNRMTSEEVLELPLKLSKEKYDKVIIALYSLNAHEKQVNRRTIAEITDIHADNISRSITFLMSIKVLEKKDKDVMLTKDGEDYARNLLMKNDEEAQSIFKELIENSTLTGKIKSYLKVNYESNEEELKNKILDFSKKKITSDNKNGASTFYDMLLYSGLLVFENDSIKLSSSKSLPVVRVPTKSVSRQIKSTTAQPKKDVTEVEYQENTIVLSFNIDSSLEEEEIIRIIKAIRKGLRESLD